MPDYRSWTTTRGRTMAGARALWRATGMKEDDFNKPIIAESFAGRSGPAGHCSKPVKTVAASDHVLALFPFIP